MAYQNVSELFRGVRNALELTQPEVAKRAGVAISTVSRLETGRLIPQAPILADLAQALLITPDQLEKVGKDRAADILRARPDGHEKPGQPSPVLEVMFDAQRALMRLGCRVTMTQPETGRFVLDCLQAAKTDSPSAETGTDELSALERES